MKKKESLGNPTALVIFGITGDLTAKKLLPSLYNLAERELLPKDLHIVGFARREWSDSFLRDYIRDAVRSTNKKADPDILDALIKNAHYVRGDFDVPDDYRKLSGFFNDLEKQYGAAFHKIHYLATAPSYYPQIFEQLGECGLSVQRKGAYSRILIEKPFGHDELSARALNKILLKSFREEQIYRIDHYLGKEPVQNIMTFRFGNSIFENLWNSKYIDNIQISAVMEDIGIETRGRFYEETGALLDVVQNHILQLVALMCMDQPASLDSEAVRDKKQAVLEKISFNLEKKSVVKAQYAAGKVSGADVPGYRQEANVNPKSKTETFAALQLSVRTPRWKNVPIYVRTGKRVDRKFTEINIEFKQNAVKFLGHPQHNLMANVLTLRIQPDESIVLKLMVKKPEFEMALDSVRMSFCYNVAYPQTIPDAYERIIFDAFRGDQFLFVRSDSILAQWHAVDALKKQWATYSLEMYAAGSAGPAGQKKLLAQTGREWWSERDTYCPMPLDPPIKG